VAYIAMFFHVGSYINYVLLNIFENRYRDNPDLVEGLELGCGVYRHFQQYVSYIVAVSFIGGGNRRIRRKPQICHKSLYYLMLYRVHLAMS